MMKKFLTKQIKSFFPNTIRRFSSINNLESSLTNEIKFEEQEYKEINPEEISVFKKNTGFEFVDYPNNSRLELKKTLKDCVVTVCYHARAPFPQEEESGKDQQESGNVTDFQVIIQKSGKTSGFIVDAVVVDSNININHVYVADNVNEFHSKYLEGKIDSDLYQGPDFSTLDETLQTAFLDYLTELGINDETAAFIEVTSLDKDQRQYVNWLKKCKNLLL